MLIQAPRHSIVQELNHQRFRVHDAGVAQRGISRVTFAHAVPPHQRMVCSALGARPAGIFDCYWAP